MPQPNRHPVPQLEFNGMMTRLGKLWHGLTSPAAADEAEAEREHMTKAMLLIISLVMVAAVPVSIVTWLLEGTDPDLPIAASVLGLFFMGAWWLAWGGRWRWASYLPPGAVFALALFDTFTFGLGGTNIMEYTVAILLTALLLGNKAQWVAWLISVVGGLSLEWVHLLSNPDVPSTEFWYWALVSTFFYLMIVLLLQFYANQFAKTLARARTFALELNKEISSRRHAEATARVGLEISSTLDLNRVLERIASRAQDLLEADTAAIFFQYGTEGLFEIAVTVGDRDPQGGSFSPERESEIIDIVTRTGEAHVDNYSKRTRESLGKKSEGSESSINTSSVMGAPLISLSRTIGVMTLQRNLQRGYFKRSDVDFLIGLTRQATAAIDNAQLYETANREKEKAEESRQMAEAASVAKTTFLANMSHEFRTPLNAILGFSQLMSKEPDLPAKQKESLDAIIRSGEHLLALVNDVLNLSKIEAGHVELRPRSFDLWRLLEDLDDIMRIKTEAKGLTLQTTIDPTTPRFVHTDEVKLKEVLINLLSNAVKCTDGGSVRLRAAPGESVPADEEEPTSRQARLIFVVEDTGIGIADSHLESIFEPFVQATDGDRSRHGTGLGLSISRQFARLMGGDLEVRSERGKGTTMTFDALVEVVDSSRVTTLLADARVAALMPDQPQYRMVVAEDDELSRRLLLRILAPLKFDITEAANGEQAVDAVIRTRPHLVWMDLRMPLMDGCEATRRIRSSADGDSVVVIAMTAGGFDADRDEALAAGCNDFVRKPFQENEIYDAIKSNLGVRFRFSKVKHRADPKERENRDVLLMASTNEDWREELRQATLEGDNARVDELVTQVSFEYPELTRKVAEFAAQFNHDAILHLIDESMKGCRP